MPASAGMTVSGAGMTVSGAGVTVSGAGMTKDRNAKSCTSLRTSGVLDHGTSGALNLGNYIQI